MKILKYELNIGNNQTMFFFAPENDSVVPGTIAGLSKNNWKLDKIDFKPEDVFVDIGCSVGILSMFVAKMFPFIKIHSFDANPIAIECLKMGIKANNITNINYYNLAIGDENRSNVEFLTYNENESCLVQKELCTNERFTKYLCDLICIDKIFDDFNLTKIKYLKMDIETGEFPVFDFIFEKRRDILDKIEFLQIELHPFDQSFPRSKNLKEKLDAHFKEKVFY